MGGVAAIISKSAVAPIERVKLLLQNQSEMIKRGQLKKPYLGVANSFKRVFMEEGLIAFWRGHQANIIRYFPTQVSYSFLDTLIKVKDLYPHPPLSFKLSHLWTIVSYKFVVFLLLYNSISTKW